MKLAAAVCSALLMVVCLVLAASGPGDENDAAEKPAVEIVRLSPETWDEFAPAGKEVDAIYGDVVLRGGHLVAVIAQPLAGRHANMTVRDVAGTLIDLTTREQQSDQLSAFYPGRRQYPFRSWSFADADGRPVDLESGRAFSGRAGSVTVKAAGTENRPQVEVTYRLAADAPALTVVTRYTNTGRKPLTVRLEDDIRADARKEDMLKAPNGEMRLFWIHDVFWRQAYGVDAGDVLIQANSNDRTSTLRYRRADGDDSVTLEPGGSFELSRRVYPARDLLEVKAIAARSRGEKPLAVKIAVLDGRSRPIPQARVEITRNKRLIGQAVTDDGGRMRASLPPGDYTIKVTALGAVIARKPLRVEAKDVSADFKLDYTPGTVEAKITDEAGGPIPCKVEFVPRGETPRPYFGPETAEFGVRNLRYAPHGTITQTLPAGSYEVIVSRGPEYDAIFTELTVKPGETTKLTGRLVRSVKTPGWISSDFHSHASPSGDNTSSQLGRVVNLLCEHVEFAPCTEHNRISTYQPHIDRLKVGRWIASCSGIELTGQPLPLNHQNAFPLVHRPRTQDGGAPLTDTSPERQIERLALWDDRSEKLVQQNHPDIGWLFFDKNGDGRPDEGYSRAFALMDVIEIHPIPSALEHKPVVKYAGRDKYPNRIFHWLQLLNQGFRIPGVVNTDAHYNYHGSGPLRNWIASPTDDPARIEPLDVVRAAEAGRMILSNGPYLEVALRESGPPSAGRAVTAGGELTARSGRVTLDVRVQCPNWLDIDRVLVLVNGRIDPAHEYTRKKNPDKFGEGTVKFDQSLQLQLERDAHVIVVAGAGERTVGRVMGPTWGAQKPAALSNPIFVDVDGGGFRPSGDTLGEPLPVKFDTR